ncbi:MAG: CocE/NonD family hydrolase [Pedosphaera sp.]|nr:CocE/NonD family hydrolase [Pedosphaera sp.]
MRDGVRLHTIIAVPKGAKGAPIILNRTPYDAGKKFSRLESPNLAAVVPFFMDTVAEARCIIVAQDVRGKYKSEGNYVMNRPPIGPLNASDTDHATDTFDSIDWLVKHLPESNGRVAIVGGSYEGFTALMGTLRPHPALKVAIAYAPMVDGWMGDDWFQNGAFRQKGSLDYIYGQEATRDGSEEWWSGHRDEYAEWLEQGSPGDMAKAKGIDGLGFWKTLIAHPTYDAFWQEQALDRFFARQPITVPLIIVSGLFDQEDIYGGSALFRALSKRADAAGRLHLVLGPWNHGGGRREGGEIGPIHFDGQNAVWIRRTVVQPFLEHYLKDASKPDLAPALVYQTGTDRWEKFQTWPAGCVAGCAAKTKPIYLHAKGGLEFEPPGRAAATSDSFVSDPAKPVPYMPRPVVSMGPESRWGEWLLIDQRFVDGRPDVLTYTTERLTQPVTISGEPVARLFAATTGSDADWVVKLIDVWPDQDVNRPVMGGYQQMIAASILRGRYREDFARPKPIEPGKVLEYKVRLPHANHMFLPGHRIMVQIQSTWFPLYDRNPQTYVGNIFFAQPADYVAVTHTIHHSPDQPSAIELPVVEGAAR